MPDFRSLISRMADRLDRCQQLLTDDRTELDPLAAEARKALAQSEPEGPTDEELDELAWNWYSKTGSTWYQIAAFRAFARAVLARWGRSDGPAVPDGREPASVASDASGAVPAAGKVTELASYQRVPMALLERLAPQPIAVSERLPGPEDCEDEGWAWFFNKRIGWRQAVLPVSPGFSHWLPAHALPVPGEGEQ